MDELDRLLASTQVPDLGKRKPGITEDQKTLLLQIGAHLTEIQHAIEMAFPEGPDSCPVLDWPHVSGLHSGIAMLNAGIHDYFGMKA